MVVYEGNMGCVDLAKSLGVLKIPNVMMELNVETPKNYGVGDAEQRGCIEP